MKVGTLVTALGILAISTAAYAAQTAPPAKAAPKPAPAPAPAPAAIAPKPASNSHESWATGTIERYDATAKSVIIKQGAAEMTFALAADAKVVDGKKALQAGALGTDTGRSVKVRYTTKAGTNTADRIEFDAAPVKPIKKK